MQLRGRTSSEVAPAGACLAPSAPDQSAREDASGAEPQGSSSLKDSATQSLCYCLSSRVVSGWVELREI
jgi:hypothetical protein